MDLCVFVAHPDGYQRNKIEKEIERYSLLADIKKLSFLHCEKTKALEHLKEKHWKMIRLAFVSLDYSDALHIGEMIYRRNPSCRLVYFGKEDSQIRNLLPSRPVWYWNGIDEKELQEVFQKQLESMKNDPYYFWYSDRMRSMSVPVEQILYAYSLKRAVYLHTQTEEVGPLPKSLDEIQENLPDYHFTRVHQSFLVNNQYVRGLNKSTKTLYLANDIEIPVSRALYEQARTIFCQNNSFNNQNDEMTDSKNHL